jgi:hypothetical protein
MDDLLKLAGAIRKPVEAITAHVEYLTSDNERLHTLLSTLYVNALRSTSDDPLIEFMRDHLSDVQHGKKTLAEAITPSPNDASEQVGP